MRRNSLPSFQVEVRRSKRPPLAVRPLQSPNRPHQGLVFESDEIPEKDVNDDLPGDIARAEAALFGGLNGTPGHDEFDPDQTVFARKLTGRVAPPSDTARAFREAALRRDEERRRKQQARDERRQALAPSRPQQPEVEAEATPERIEPASPTNRVLPSLLEPAIPEPVRSEVRNERASRRTRYFNAGDQKKPATARRRSEAKPASSTDLFAYKPPAGPSTLPKQVPASDEAKTTQRASVQAQAVSQIRPEAFDRALTARPPRRRAMLHNAWMSKRIKKDAQNFPQTAHRALKPGEAWKRRLPVKMW